MLFFLLLQIQLLLFSFLFFSFFFLFSLFFLTNGLYVCIYSFYKIIIGREDLVAPRFPGLFRFTMNMSMVCFSVQAARDDATTEAEEIVMFRLIDSGRNSVMLSDPVLTLIIEPDPPSISVPGSVDASAGNAAVVCFTAFFPTDGEATIALSPMNVTAGKTYCC